jgi:hypothetical protein
VIIDFVKSAMYLTCFTAKLCLAGTTNPDTGRERRRHAYTHISPVGAGQPQYERKMLVPSKWKPGLKNGDTVKELLNEWPNVISLQSGGDPGALVDAAIESVQSKIQ